jgi:predicted GNAT family acetyltransferase
MTDQTITVHDNADDHRYEVFVDGDLAGFSAYRDEPGRRVFTHTKIDPDYEGHGVGSALARGALDDVRSRELRVLPRCPFIAEYIDRHPQYADLVTPR